MADVGRYPEFLPWVAAVRIRAHDGHEMLADMSVGFRSIRETFTSRVTLDRPRHIHVDYVSGPLRHLRNDWRFAETPSGATVITFDVDFEFKSPFFQKVAGLFFHEAFRQMVGSFERRAGQLYGRSSLSATSVA